MILAERCITSSHGLTEPQNQCNIDEMSPDSYLTIWRIQLKNLNFEIRMEARVIYNCGPPKHPSIIGAPFFNGFDLNNFILPKTVSLLKNVFRRCLLCVGLIHSSHVLVDSDMFCFSFFTRTSDFPLKYGNAVVTAWLQSSRSFLVGGTRCRCLDSPK